MFISLEFGHKEIRCVCLERKGNSLFISQTGTLSFSDDIFREKDTQKVSSFLKDFFKKKRFSPKYIYFSLYHKDVIFQELLLPLMPYKEIEGVVINEIEKLPHFSSTNYVCTYQIYDLSDKKKLKVLYLAFPKSDLEFCLKVLKKSGCNNIKGFDITPLSLLNLYYVKSGLKDTALVLLEDRLSYVLISSKGKCSVLYVANSGFDDICDSNKSKVDELSFKAWAEEIKRTFKFYEIESRKNISGIVLVWDNEKISDLDKTFSSYINREVNRPELPKQIKLYKKNLTSPLNYKYFPSIGTALKALKIKHEFNLERIWCKEKTPEYSRKLILYTFTYILITAILSTSFIFNLINKTRNLVVERKQLSEKIRVLEKKTSQLNTERNSYLKLKEEILKQASFIAKLNKKSWSKAFLKAGEVLPSDVWLKSFSLDESGSFKIEGWGITLDSVAGFMRALKNVDFFSDVKFSFIREREIEKKVVEEFGISSRVKINTYNTYKK